MILKIVVLTVAISSLAIGADVSASSPKAHQPSVSQRTPFEGDTQIRTFIGTVWMNGGKFVLRDESQKVWYKLDDQRSAAKFEGKHVRVTGKLETANNLIRVQDIEEDRN